jgi:hypothetical protein
VTARVHDTRTRGKGARAGAAHTARAAANRRESASNAPFATRGSCSVACPPPPSARTPVSESSYLGQRWPGTRGGVSEVSGAAVGGCLLCESFTSKETRERRQSGLKMSGRTCISSTANVAPAWRASEAHRCSPLCQSSPKLTALCARKALVQVRVGARTMRCAHQDLGATTRGAGRCQRLALSSAGTVVGGRQRR